MSKNLLKKYMQQAQQIIGKRTPAEIAHNDKVVARLEMGLPIEAVLANAAQKHPSKALQWDHNNISDIASHDDYLKEHARIMKMMQVKKPQ